MKRAGPLSRRAQKRASTPGELAKAKLWHLAVTSPGVCAITGKPPVFGEPDTYLEAHHVIPKRLLRQEGHWRELWNIDNGLCLSSRAHRRHTTALEPIPYDVLQPHHHSFAHRLGLDWYLDRHYPRRSPMPHLAEGLVSPPTEGAS